MGGCQVKEPNSRCPTCNAPLKKQQTDSPEPGNPETNDEVPEIDHRGIVMPRRTRMGGIIMPQ
jgi:hypothetical protein